MSKRPQRARPNVEPSVLDAARSRIRAIFSQPVSKRDKLSAGRLLQSLEKIIGVPKGDWNGSSSAPCGRRLEGAIASRKHSIEHEETWLILAGFLLRPGFGAPLDEARMDGLWQASAMLGLYFPGKRIKLQEYILWRRVAGGLSRERQERVLASELDRLRQQKSPPPELIRLAGSLERIGHELKSELVRRFIEKAATLARERQHCAPTSPRWRCCSTARSSTPDRKPSLHRSWVERAYDAFTGFDWADPELAEMQTLFLRAARVVDDRVSTCREHCAIA